MFSEKECFLKSPNEQGDIIVLSNVKARGYSHPLGGQGSYPLPVCLPANWPACLAMPEVLLSTLVMFERSR